MRLEHWAVTAGEGVSPYTPPECATFHLVGEVYGHAYRPDGVVIRTSSIERIENGLVVTKSGSMYELGEVAADYEAAYPDARKRLLGGSR